MLPAPSLVLEVSLVQLAPRAMQDPRVPLVPQVAQVPQVPAEGRADQPEPQAIPDQQVPLVSRDQLEARAWVPRDPRGLTVVLPEPAGTWAPLVPLAGLAQLAQQDPQALTALLLVPLDLWEQAPLVPRDSGSEDQLATLDLRAYQATATPVPLAATAQSQAQLATLDPQVTRDQLVPTAPSWGPQDTLVPLASVGQLASLVPPDRQALSLVPLVSPVLPGQRAKLDQQVATALSQVPLGTLDQQVATALSQVPRAGLATLDPLVRPAPYQDPLDPLALDSQAALVPAD